MYNKVFQENATHLRAKYSSICLEADLGSKAEVNARINAANDTWKKYWYVWKNSALPAVDKARVYKAAVLPIILACLDTCVLGTSVVLRLEKWQMNKLRVMFLGSAVGLTNAAIREHVKVPTVETQLLSKRFSLWQELFRRPTEHVAALSAMFGHIEGVPDQIVSGKLSSHASPWARQFQRDISKMCKLSSVLATQVRRHSISHLADVSEFLSFNRKRLLSFQVSHEPVQTEVEQYVCSLCHFVFGSKVGRALHLYQTHHVQHPCFKFVLTNQCPTCCRMFSTVRQARKHVAYYFPSLEHGHSRNERSFVIRHSAVSRCRACSDYPFSNHAQMLQHCAEHIASLARESSQNAELANVYCTTPCQHARPQRERRRQGQGKILSGQKLKQGAWKR